LGNKPLLFQGGGGGSVTTSHEATTLGEHPDVVAKPSLTVEDYIDGDNMIIEYNPNDVFGDHD
jgi:hypothetical protein